MSTPEIGKPGDASTAAWIGKILGMSLPVSYLKLLARHDGATGLDEPSPYALMFSMKTYAIYRDRWGEPRRFWPVSGDGCGNYYVLVDSRKDAAGESPVAFVETIQSAVEPAYWAASTYAHFVFFSMTRRCAQRRCRKFVRYPSRQAWPFDPHFVLAIDPALERLQPRGRWPK